MYLWIWSRQCLYIIKKFKMSSFEWCIVHFPTTNQSRAIGFQRYPIFSIGLHGRPNDLNGLHVKKHIHSFLFPRKVILYTNITKIICSRIKEGLQSVLILVIKCAICTLVIEVAAELERDVVSRTSQHEFLVHIQSAFQHAKTSHMKFLKKCFNSNQSKYANAGYFYQPVFLCKTASASQVVHQNTPPIARADLRFLLTLTNYRLASTSCHQNFWLGSTFWWGQQLCLFCLQMANGPGIWRENVGFPAKSAIAGKVKMSSE